MSKHYTKELHFAPVLNIWLTDNKRGNLLLPLYGLLFPIRNKGSLISTNLTECRIAHTTAFATPVVGHWLEQEIAQWIHLVGLIAKPPQYEQVI